MTQSYQWFKEPYGNSVAIL